MFGGDTEAESASAVIAALRREGFGDLDDQRVVQSLLAIRGGDVARYLHDEFAPRGPCQVVRRHRTGVVPHDWVPAPPGCPAPPAGPVDASHPGSRRVLSPAPRADPVDRTAPGPLALARLGPWVRPKWADGGASPVGAGRPPVEGQPRDGSERLRRGRGAPGSRPGRSVAFHRGRGLPHRLGHRQACAAGARPPRPDGLDGRAHRPGRRARCSGVRAITDLVPDHRSNLAARGFWPNVDPFPTGHEAPAVLASHAIDDAAAAALRAGDVDRFLRVRGHTIAEKAARLIGSRTEPGATTARR